MASQIHGHIISYSWGLLLTLTEIRTWISNYINCFMWDVIIHPCTNCNGCLNKQLLMLRHGWVITSSCFMLMLLFIHVLDITRIVLISVSNPGHWPQQHMDATDMHFTTLGFPIFTWAWWDSRWCFLADFQLASTTCEVKDAFRKLDYPLDIPSVNLQMIFCGKIWQIFLAPSCSWYWHILDTKIWICS